jgi:hypothetical protein
MAIRRGRLRFWRAGRSEGLGAWWVNPLVSERNDPPNGSQSCGLAFAWEGLGEPRFAGLLGRLSLTSLSFANAEDLCYRPLNRWFFLTT